MSGHSHDRQRSKPNQSPHGSASSDIIRIPCYEGPNGDGLPGSIELGDEDLLRHMMILGSTGAGKSTLLRRLTMEIIARNAGDGDEKTAVILFDFKGDDSIELVTRWATKCGRDPWREHAGRLLCSPILGWKEARNDFRK